MADKIYKLELRLCDVYFQKSYKFIFPLLKIRTDSFTPVQTYLTWLDLVKKDERKLICVYKLGDTENYKKFEVNHLFAHKLFDDFRLIEGNYGAYIFSLESFKNDIDHFYNGQYSKMSTEVKKTILDYYSPNKLTREYFESYLDPEKFYPIYAKHLDIDIKEIENGELCAAYDPNKEQLTLKEVIINFKSA